MTLRRINRGRGHSYQIDGKKVDGVTTLIGEGVPKPALINWASRTVAAYAAEHLDTLWSMRQGGMSDKAIAASIEGSARGQRDEKAVTGTEVHKLAERLVYGEAVIVPPHVDAYVNSTVEFLDEFDPTPIITETPVGSRQWAYGGTLDVCWEFPRAIVCRECGRRLKRVLGDLKTSNRVYGETALQLAGYRNAEFYLGDDGEEHLMDELGLDPDHAFVLHISPQRADLLPARCGKDQFETFLYAAAVARARWRMRDEAWVGDPVDPSTERDEG